MDELPAEGDTPVVDPEADDEGLLAFVQARSCRRRIWAEVFESPVERTSCQCPLSERRLLTTPRV